MSREFILKRGSLQERFLNMTAKIQLYGGGFGNGKTTALVIKALQLVQDYPGCTGLLARSTYPKLNDTLRKEFIKWCPPEFIKSFPIGQNSSNICTLKNGSQIYFRYIAQQGNSERGTTSNLLSATYDFVGVDQVEDPEITHKDFLDLFGRLRGSARYMGDDPSMPRTGPRWMMLACNPTGNWVYTKIVRPLHIYNKTGIVTKELLCVRDPDGNPILDAQGKPQLLLDIVEGSTYELRHIHEADGGDFIQTQESMYQGQMRERFLMGKWASYEGLVYPKFDISTHGVHERDIRDYLDELRANGYEPAWVEGYDFGQSSPSCYLLGFTSPQGQVIICDGFYEKELALDDQFEKIKNIRDKWLSPHSDISAMEVDPSIFGRKGITRAQVGKKISDMFVEAGIKVRKGNNDIQSGIVKVGQYIAINRKLPNPFDKCLGAPRLFVNNELSWFNDEISSYYWKQNTSGEYIDRPNDTNDHAMDALKYLLSRQPEVGNLFTPESAQVPSFLKWHMIEHNRNTRSHRYG
jgi:hypothetical protein